MDKSANNFSRQGWLIRSPLKCSMQDLHGMPGSHWSQNKRKSRELTGGLRFTYPFLALSTVGAGFDDPHECCILPLIGSEPTSSPTLTSSAIWASSGRNQFASATVDLVLHPSQARGRGGGSGAARAAPRDALGNGNSPRDFNFEGRFIYLRRLNP